MKNRILNVLARWWSELEFEPGWVVPKDKVQANAIIEAFIEIMNIK